MKKAWKSLDYSLLLPLMILCTIGVIMVYSASAIVAITRYDYPSNYFFKSQLKAVGLGSIGLLIMLFIPYHVWKKRIVTVGITVVSIGLLIAVLRFGKEVNHAQAWVWGMQPAEFAKLSVIVMLARFLAKKHDMNTSYVRGVGGIAIYILLVLALIGKQPDFGTDLLISAIIAIMILCSGISVKLLFKRLALTSIIWGPLLYFGAMAKLSKVQMARFTAFANPFADPGITGFHLINSFIAIADGGLKGLGLGNSLQKNGYLPEPHTDFIMAIVSEELGFLGVAIILASLTLIVLRAFKIAQRCQDPFGSLLAIGIGGMIGVQSIVNIGGITGSIPLTGVPLPFISFGGTSLVVNLAAMGLLLNISARVKEQEIKKIKPVPEQPKRHLVVVK